MSVCMCLHVVEGVRTRTAVWQNPSGRPILYGTARSRCALTAVLLHTLPPTCLRPPVGRLDALHLCGQVVLAGKVGRRAALDGRRGRVDRAGGDARVLLSEGLRGILAVLDDSELVLELLYLLLQLLVLRRLARGRLVLLDLQLLLLLPRVIGLVERGPKQGSNRGRAGLIVREGGRAAN